MHKLGPAPFFLQSPKGEVTPLISQQHFEPIPKSSALHILNYYENTTNQCQEMMVLEGSTGEVVPPQQDMYKVGYQICTHICLDGRSSCAAVRKDPPRLMRENREP